MSDDAQKQSYPVFKSAVGKAFEVTDFDEYNLARLEFDIRIGPERGMHTIWVEPYLLKVLRKNRANNNSLNRTRDSYVPRYRGNTWRRAG